MAGESMVSGRIHDQWKNPWLVEESMVRTFVHTDGVVSIIQRLHPVIVELKVPSGTVRWVSVYD
jgi:hypothetical protein